MRCPETSLLVDMVYEESDSSEHGSVPTHLEECQECRARWTRLLAVLTVADRWATPSVSPGIADRAIARIASERARSSIADWAPIAWRHLLGCLLFGAGAASLSLLLLLVSGIRQEEGKSLLTIGLVGPLWTALYGGVGFLTIHGRHRHLARGALVGSGITVLVTPLLSMPAVIEAPRRWLEVAHSPLLPNLEILIAGILYAATSAFVSGVTVARGSCGLLLADTTWLAGAYAALVAPSAFVQCQHLALGLTVAWVGGMLVGAFLGCLGGVSLSARLRVAMT